MPSLVWRHRDGAIGRLLRNSTEPPHRAPQMSWKGSPAVRGWPPQERRPQSLGKGPSPSLWSFSVQAVIGRSASFSQATASVSEPEIGNGSDPEF